MTHLPITLATAGILGLIFLALTGGVTSQRFRSRVMLGEGGSEPGAAALKLAVRAHANFAEYVPLALILLAGIEAAGAPRDLVIGLAVALVLGRLGHAFGMFRPAPNPFRACGALVTWAVIGVACVTALILA
ncbi:MAG TPA: MAPEG family protein [Acidocella sp.]|nr:MAPEG family protein [Acidocella sp.]